MPYAIRNTLVLLVLLVVVIMGSCIGNASSSKKLEKANKKRVELVKRVSNLKKELSLSSSQDQLEDVLKELGSNKIAKGMNLRNLFVKKFGVSIEEEEV